MKKDYTHLSIVADRSGSMASIREDSQGGINTLIKEQAKVDGEITVSLYEFDTHYTKVFGPLPASEAPAYNLVPRGGTALRDAAYKAIVDTGTYLRGLPESERPDKVVFAIVTDGDENSSREISQEQLKALIEKQTNDYNWEFVFLGANIDAFSVGASYGIRMSTSYQATGASAAGAYNNLSSSLATARVQRGAVADVMASVIDNDGNASNTTSS